MAALMVATALTAPALPVRGQGVTSAYDELQEVMVTGTIIREETAFHAIPRLSVSSEWIRAMQAPTVGDLLRSLPGVNVTQQGGAGGPAFVSLRGGDPNATVVMIDGLRVNDPTNSMGGGFDFSGLDPLLIEKIDIYFGGYSAVYGSDSLSGAINITTHNAAPSAILRAYAEGGTDDSNAQMVRFAGPISESIEGSIVVASRNGGNGVEGDHLDRQQISARVRSSPSDNRKAFWGMSVFKSLSLTRSFPISSGGPRLAVLRDVEESESDQFNLGVNFELIPTDSWRIRLSGERTQHDVETDTPAIAPGVQSGTPALWTDSRFTRSSLSLTNTISLEGLPTFGFGAELVHEDGEISSLIDFGFPLPADFSLSRSTRAIVGEMAYDIADRANLLATIRHDMIGDSTSTNGRFNLSVMPWVKGPSMTLSYFEGFKMPSLFAIGHALTGNPDLRPETSKNLELNVRQSVFGDRNTISLAIYRNEYADLIDFDADLFLHVNRASARARGADVTFSGGRPKDRLYWSMSAGYLDTDVSDGSRLEGRPKWKGSLNLSALVSEQWRVAFDCIVNGRFVELSIPTGEIELSGYTRLDISVVRNIGPHVEVKMLVSNLLDDDYEEAVGFPGNGRQFRLGVAASM